MTMLLALRLVVLCILVIAAGGLLWAAATGRV